MFLRDSEEAREIAANESLACKPPNELAGARHCLCYTTERSKSRTVWMCDCQPAGGCCIKSFGNRSL